MKNTKIIEIDFWEDKEKEEDNQRSSNELKTHFHLNGKDCILEMNDKYVAKFLLAQNKKEGFFEKMFGCSPILGDEAIEKLFFENEILNYLVREGISFPESKGIYYVKRPLLEKEVHFFNDCDYSPALVMKKAEGQRGDKLPSFMKKIAYQKIEEEKEKMAKLGFFPKEGYNNLDKFFYDSCLHKLTLTGVNNWERR
ncbi:hypothetical protein GW932_04160 [archaeon]|nr:hypothetical protein [archaeon]